MQIPVTVMSSMVKNECLSFLNFVHYREAPCFGGKLDLQTHADNLGSVHAGGAHFLKEHGHIVLIQYEIRFARNVYFQD